MRGGTLSDGVYIRSGFSAHGAVTLGAHFAFGLLVLAMVQMAPTQASIDYDQHLRMPTEELPAGLRCSDLVKLLDEAHISRAVVLSMAYRYGNPNQPPVADEYAHVKRRTTG